MTNGTIGALPARQLPGLRAARWVALSPDGKPGPGGAARKARILVVEDEYFVSLEIETALLEIGCDLIGNVATAEEAIEQSHGGSSR